MDIVSYENNKMNIDEYKMNINECNKKKNDLEVLKDEISTRVDNKQESFIRSLVLTTSNFIGATATFTGMLMVSNNILSGMNNVSYPYSTAICTFTGINIILFPVFLKEYNKSLKVTFEKKADRDFEEVKCEKVKQKIFDCTVLKNKIELINEN